MSVSITKIEKLKNKRYGLYIDDDIFLFDIDEDTLVHFTLSKSAQLTQNKIDEIKRYDQYVSCLHQALRYLERRPHLKKELYRKLKQKSFPDRSIEQTIHYLEEKQYLDDIDYIRRFINDRSRLKKSGFLLIKKKLIEKGARAEDAEQLLLLYYNEKRQIDNAVALLEKKMKTLKEIESNKRKQKLIRFLQQKGYPWPIIESALKENAGG